MKKKYLLLLLIIPLLFGSCSNEVEETYTYKINEPIFMPASEFRSSVRVVAPKKKIEKRGKIAFFKDYLYLSEPEKGIHIINNSNPSNPKIIGFIELLGNGDLAIKDDILYADSYIDMVWFDIANPASPKLLGREEEVFPNAVPQTGNIYPYDYQEVKKRENGVVVGWNLSKKTGTYTPPGRDWWFFGGLKENSSFIDNSPTSGNVGKTGSMSRFSIYKEYLYTVKQDKLGIFNIKQATPTKVGKDVNLGWNVETIFSYKDNMFMGTPTGMIIFSVKDALNPTYISSIQHVYGCDPVVVENDIAYVTIHSGNNCGQNNNQLIIIDVKDVANPKAIVTYEMKQPKGLGISNNTLFVCDEGLKVFNASNPSTIMAEENFLAHFNNMKGFDVIAFNNLLMMIAEDGIYQYDYSNLNNIRQLSFIAIEN